VPGSICIFPAAMMYPRKEMEMRKEMSVSITELIWQAKTRGKSTKEVLLF
jgi:hypothetical protein